MTNLDRIQIDEFFAHPPAKVWRALTEPDLLARWLMPNEFKLELGHRFTFRTDPIPAANFDGTAHCEVQAFEPGRLLRITWCGSNRLNTVLTWRLEAEGRGTRLFLEHVGFDPDDPVQQLARRMMDGGWRSQVMRSLEACLAGIDSAPKPEVQKAS